MERAMIWFKCAAMHDPVRPVIKKPAVLGWEAKHRRVDLVIERPLGGVELLKRMKGWFTADVHQVADMVNRSGRLKIIDETDLVVETDDRPAMDYPWACGRCGRCGARWSTRTAIIDPSYFGGVALAFGELLLLPVDYVAEPVSDVPPELRIPWTSPLGRPFGRRLDRQSKPICEVLAR